jgi:hypothetical protein
MENGCGTHLDAGSAAWLTRLAAVLPGCGGAWRANTARSVCGRAAERAPGACSCCDASVVKYTRRPSAVTATSCSLRARRATACSFGGGGAASKNPRLAPQQASCRIVWPTTARSTARECRTVVLQGAGKLESDFKRQQRELAVRRGWGDRKWGWAEGDAMRGRRESTRVPLRVRGRDDGDVDERRALLVAGSTPPENVPPWGSSTPHQQAQSGPGAGSRCTECRGVCKQLLPVVGLSLASGLSV